MSQGNKIIDNNQLDLIDGSSGEVEPAPLPLENSEILKADGFQSGTRRRGRPVGAKNKRAETLQKYMINLGYRHPAIILGEITARPVEELAAHLNCTRLEAFREQRKAASDLLPYFEGRILPKTDEGEQALPQLHLHLDVDQVGLSGQKVIDQAPIRVAQKMAENGDIPDAEIVKSYDDDEGDLVSD